MSGGVNHQELEGPSRGARGKRSGSSIESRIMAQDCRTMIDHDLHHVTKKARPMTIQSPNFTLF